MSRFIHLCLATICILKLSAAKSGSSSNDDIEDLLGKPKNVILMIADGLGINHNAAYRLWKGLDSTILDDYLVGEFSTFAVGQSTPDSAATATAFATGILPPNERVGTDINMNPIGGILGGSKLKGKGVGIVTTVEVTHGTPAAFTSHAVQRFWEDLIAEQQAKRIVGDVDVLFGRGTSLFDGSRNDGAWNLIEDYKQFGWNSLSQTKDELLALTEDDLPAIGLYSDSALFPDTMSHINKPDIWGHVPDLLDLSKKALELLSAEYEEEGFFIMIEAGQTDYANHFNDLPWLMNAIDEYMITLDYIINDFIANRDELDTLIVMVSDHESGGLSLGRASQWDLSKIVPGPTGGDTFDKGTVEAQSIYSFDYDPLIPPPPERKDDIGVTSMYQFFTEYLDYPTSSALILSFSLQTIDPNDHVSLANAYDMIEESWIKELTVFEKEFIKTCFSRSGSALTSVLVSDCLAKIMNVRSNAGWTTHGHTANDIRISAYGPSAHRFRGFNGNIANIGKKLIAILDVKEEIEDVNQELKELFLSDTLVVCDQEGDTIPWPVGNYKYPGFCVEDFVLNIE